MLHSACGPVRCGAVPCGGVCRADLGGCVADEEHVRDDAPCEGVVREGDGAAEVEIGQAEELELACLGVGLGLG